MLPFTNIHTHVFTSDCAPDRFLKILPVKFVRRFPGLIKSGLDSKTGRKVIQTLATFLKGRNSNKRKEVDKYIAFLDVGTQATQLEVFQRAFEAGLNYDHAVRIVGLTMNMDYMDSEPSSKQISFETQLEEVKDIKRYYPANFFPFLGIDPRHKAGVDLVAWARPYFEKGVKHNVTGKVYPFFSGIKLYPALGFFPSDARLEELYGYAEKNQLPIMSHCTRVGSQYIGSKIESLIPEIPNLMTVPGNANVENARVSIEKRIKQFYDNGWVKNSKLGANDRACDLFGHPENYIPILEKFPKLKICLAHMGGSNEMLEPPLTGELAEIRKVDTPGWFERITAMMKMYPNLYTDISYTVSDFGDTKKEVFKRFVEFLKTPDNEGKLLADRVLFGTDFFMTEQEKREVELYALTQKNLREWFDLMGRTNAQKYLMQPL